MSKKGKIGLIAGGIAFLVILIAAIVVIVSGKEETYRVIKVLSVSGSGEVERESIGKLDAYDGMALQSGDRISIAGGSEMVLVMDENKYAYVQPDTVFVLYAEGTEQASKTRIDLETGGIICDVQEKLNQDSSYEISTPNSTMAIRGTIVSVENYNDLDVAKGVLRCDFLPQKGTSFSRTIVIEGNVQVGLKPEESGKSVTLSAGEGTITAGNTDANEFVIEKELLNQTALQQQLLEQLKKALNQRRENGVSTKDAEDILAEQKSGKADVVFSFNEKVFAQCSVEDIETGSLEEPILQPALEGNWDYDFSKTFKDNNYPNVVYWKENSK